VDLDSIISQLKQERERLDRAIAVLDGAAPGRRGRPRGAAAGTNSTGRRRRHRLTPEGRKRLSEMMKKRWAERRRKKAA
jgi:hypothetical protein